MDLFLWEILFIFVSVNKKKIMENLLTLYNAGLALALMITLMLVKSVIGKLSGTTEMVQNFDFMRLQKYTVLVGLSELVAVVLLFVPGYSLYGAVLLACIMSGATALHLSLMGGNKVTLPVVIGVLGVLSHVLRTL